MIEIPNNKQLVFDTVAEHLLKQGKQSFYIDNNFVEVCAYRGHGGLKCAAGCLIPDEQYDSSIESIGWCKLVYDRVVSHNCLDLISDLQHIHDTVNPKDWLLCLHEYADKKGLNKSKLPPLQ